INNASTLRLVGCNTAVGCSGGVLGSADGGYINLGAGVNEQVAALMLSVDNGATFAAQPNGTYGSSASSAAFKLDEYFAGTGVLTVGLPGDYNSDGKEDAADYVTWRKNPSVFGGNPAGYNNWRANFGAGSGVGTGAVIGSNRAVPEPTWPAL